MTNIGNSNSLHGKLRLLAKTSSVSTSANRRKRPCAYASRGAGRVAPIRNAWKRRRDRLTIVSVSESESVGGDSKAESNNNNSNNNDNESNNNKKNNKNNDKGGNKQDTSATTTTTTTNSKNAEGDKSSSAQPLQIKIKTESSSGSSSSSTTATANKDGGGATTEPSESSKPKTKTTTVVVEMRSADLEEYAAAEERQRRALENIERARRKVYKDQVEGVWGLYTYGLHHVLAVKDLSDAPDGIMMKPM